MRELYTGADWAGQAHLLEQPSVRSDVLTVLRTHPANLGEGYVYPGFSTTGWVGPIDRTDATVLGLTPESLPKPITGYGGYQTAFFLALEDGGPLQWRRIDAPNGVADRQPPADNGRPYDQLRRAIESLPLN